MKGFCSENLETGYFDTRKMRFAILPLLRLFFFFFFLVKVDILHGFLLKGIVGWKNLQLGSLGRFVVAKMLTVKSFSYKNVLSHFLF